MSDHKCTHQVILEKARSQIADLEATNKALLKIVDEQDDRNAELEARIAELEGTTVKDYTERGCDGVCEFIQRWCPENETIEQMAREIQRLQDQRDELKQEVEDVRIGAYIRAMWDFAWWKDGEQYVGCGAKTLRQATDDAIKEHSND